MWLGAPKDVQRSRELRGRGKTVPVPSGTSITTAPRVPILCQRRVTSIVSRGFDIDNRSPPFRFFDYALLRERRRERSRLSVGTCGGGGRRLVIQRRDRGRGSAFGEFWT